jgi:hypothetical protein
VPLWDEIVVERRSTSPASSLPYEQPLQLELPNQTQMITNRVELRSLQCGFSCNSPISIPQKPATSSPSLKWELSTS